MKIDYTNLIPVTTFGMLKPGDFFRNEKNEGLFLKIKPIDDHKCTANKAVAIIVDSIDQGVPPGDTTGWRDHEVVTPIISITVNVAGTPE